MHAAVLKGFGGVEQLELENVTDPVAAADEVLVRVRAISINPIDWKIRSGATRGRIDVTLPAILGRDLAGEVERAGEGVTGFTQGQRVMALARSTYAELAVVKANELTPMPEKLSFEEAAALPLVSLTGAQLIERAIKIERGQTVLVLGALGGVGRTAVHVALEHGAKVIAGVRKKQVGDAEVLGAQQVVALDDPEQMETLRDLDAVADTIGGSVAAQTLRVLKKGGVFGSVLAPPADAEKYGVRTASFMAQPDAARLAELANDAALGKFTIPIAKVLPFDWIREAHRKAEDHPNGKIIVKTS